MTQQQWNLIKCRPMMA